jgi:hypothetical protein
MKFPDLTLIAYNSALKNLDKYPKPPKLYILNFDDLSRSHRCNPLYPENMLDITDATEASRSIMLGLNKSWIQKTGDFFVESPINFLTALIWFLKKYKGGIYCTLPHVIELAQQEYDKLFPVLALDGEIDVLLNPFISAYLRSAHDQLEGQIASAKIGLARLVSPTLYYVMSGNDFSLDVNNPTHPKIVCAGNNPAKLQTYGAVLSLYTERMLKLVNKKGQLKSNLVFDEYSSLYADLSATISTGRSNRIAVILGVQDLSQIRRDYGKEQADVVMNICGNVISGQVLGETAKMMSDRIGKIMQERESLSINSNDTSVSKSYQLDSAVPAAKIAGLSSGEFVGAVADNPQQKIKLKAFHCEILNDHEAMRKEEESYQQLPIIRNVTDDMVMDNYYQIKRDIQNLVEIEMKKIKGSTAAESESPPPATGTDNASSSPATGMSL